MTGELQYQSWWSLTTMMMGMLCCALNALRQHNTLHTHIHTHSACLAIEWPHKKECVACQRSAGKKWNLLESILQHKFYASYTTNQFPARDLTVRVKVAKRASRVLQHICCALAQMTSSSNKLTFNVVSLRTQQSVAHLNMCGLSCVCCTLLLPILFDGTFRVLSSSFRYGYNFLYVSLCVYSLHFA